MPALACGIVLADDIVDGAQMVKRKDCRIEACLDKRSSGVEVESVEKWVAYYTEVSPVTCANMLHRRRSE